MNDNNKSEPATKADLKELATKTDLNKLAQTTKADLAELKTELNKKINSVAIELAKTQADVRGIKETIATKLATRDDISRLMNHIDAFAGEALSYRNHDTLRGGKIMEHETKLSDHENRLTTLETK